MSDEANDFKEIELGTVDIDKKSRGKLDLGFNAKAVAQSNLNIDNFNILILKREDHLTKQFEIILGGYIHKDDDSISKVKSKDRNKIEIKQEAPKIEKIAKTPEVSEISEASEEKTILKDDPKDDFSLALESHIEHYQNPDRKSNISQVKENTDKHYNDQIASYTEDILKIFKQVNPFKIEFEDYKWWQINTITICLE